MRVLGEASVVCVLTLLPYTPIKGHIEAARAIGSIYFWGHGMAIDYARAMAAYKVGAKGGRALCQHQVGFMYSMSHGVAADYQQARAWLGKAAAQDEAAAVGSLGAVHKLGKGVTRSYHRARELYQRAIELGAELGSSMAVENMQSLTNDIQKVS